jgi:hypothetical protein
VHGVIFAELEKFVGAAAGPDAWPKLLAAAGLVASGERWKSRTGVGSQQS